MSAFKPKSPEFHKFLTTAKDNLALVPMSEHGHQNTRFIARSFLNEERLDTSRVKNYAIHLNTLSDIDFNKWNGTHNNYLKEHVYISPSTLHDYRFVDKNQPKTYPETFRSPVNLQKFQDVDMDITFIRLVSIEKIASFSGYNAEDIFLLGEQFVNNTKQKNPAKDKLTEIFDLMDKNPHSKHRPVFAAFYEDFFDELNNSTNTEWPNQLRDKMGLYHIPTVGTSCRIFLFLYKVREIPWFLTETFRRPIAVPVVFDQQLYSAFCPVPLELHTGLSMNIKETITEIPAREILHLYMPLKVEHLFRVGTVTTPSSEDLAPARRNHLKWIQKLSDRIFYASTTDADILQ